VAFIYSCSSQSLLSRSDNMTSADALVAQFIGRVMVLQDTIRNSTDRESTSAEETTKLINELERMCNRADVVKVLKIQVMRIMRLTMQIGLAQHDVDRMVEKLAGLTAKKSVTWVMQNYINLPRYFTDSDWQAVQVAQARMFDQCSNSMDAVQQVLFGKAIALQCQHPSERTTKVWTAFLLVVFKHKWGGGAWPDMEFMVSAHAAVKKAFKTMQASMQTMAMPDSECPRIKTLPALPASLQETHPTLWARVFGEHAPSACRVDMAYVASMAGTWQCRGQRSTGCMPMQLQMHANQLQAIGNQPSQPLDIGLTICDQPSQWMRRSGSFSSSSSPGSPQQSHGRMLQDMPPALPPVSPDQARHTVMPPALSPGGVLKRACDASDALQNADASTVLAALRGRAEDKKLLERQKKLNQKLKQQRTQKMGDDDVDDDDVESSVAAEGEAEREAEVEAEDEATPIAKLVRKKPAATKLKRNVEAKPHAKKKAAPSNAGTKYQLRFERTRLQYLAHDGKAWKTFSFANGGRFKSKTDALTGAYGYLDKMLRQDGKGVKFPRQCNSIVV